MLEEYTRQHAHTSDRDVPVVVALMPATSRQRAVAVGVVVALLALAALVAPFANVQIGRIDSFVPVLQTVLSGADLLTATFLFAQYSVQPHRALLAAASAYLFSGSAAFLQTLSFPGGYAPGGIIGDGYNTPAWFFVLWHTTYPLSILTYALLKDKNDTPVRSTTANIAVTLSCVFGAMAALTWLVTVGVGYLPSFYTTSVTLQTRLANQTNVPFLLLGALPLLVPFSPTPPL